MSKYEGLMRVTFRLAAAARRKGNHPFGALLALDDSVLLTAENSVNSGKDVTQHAELNLVSQATRQLDTAILQQATLYTSTEPCAMCAGAIFWAGIPKIVYGCAAETLGALAGGEFVIPSRHIFSFGTREVKVIGPVLAEEAAVVHEGFWP
ncbi:MAG: nucleoside deaminase [Chloroflexi bacterium]|jgi:tRNA(Arg) A34 adenosine deaminase TadA|nr:nucleoside deaminase [Chloroflexota bacterium]